MTDTTKPQAKTGHRAKRPIRIPMSGSRKRLHIPDEFKDPNFHYAWISDKDNLIFRAKRAGYECVRQSEMPQLSFDIDTSSAEDGLIQANAGAGVIQFLMKQPMEYHEEDLAEQRQMNEDRVAGIKRELNSGKDGTYGKVEIS